MCIAWCTINKLQESIDPTWPGLLADMSFILQVGVFSATLPPEALEITKKFMSKPVRILVKRDELTLEGIKQVCTMSWLVWSFHRF